MNEETFSDDNSESEQRNKYTPKLIHKNERIYNITFIHNDWKRRKYRGQYIRAKIPPTGPRRNTPSKRSKYRIIKAFHKYWHREEEHFRRPTITGFRKKYSNHHTGPKRWINKVSHRTWRRYKNEFQPGTVKWNTLKEYVRKNGLKKNKKKEKILYRSTY